MFLDLNIKADGSLDINEPIVSINTKEGFSRYLYSMLTTLAGDIKVNRSFGASVVKHIGSFVSIKKRDELKNAIKRELYKINKYLLDEPEVFVRIMGDGLDAHYVIAISVGYLGSYLFEIKYGSRGLYYVDEDFVETEAIVSDETAGMLQSMSDNTYLNGR